MKNNYIIRHDNNRQVKFYNSDFFYHESSLSPIKTIQSAIINVCTHSMKHKERKIVTHIASISYSSPVDQKNSMSTEYVWR